MPEPRTPVGYDPDAEVFNLEHAAWFCGQLHPQTLRRSTCPRSKPAGVLLFERSVLLQWVAAHRSHQVAA
jgi:hypothetical protein